MSFSSDIILVIVIRVVFFVVVYTYKKWRSYIAFRAAVAEHGCERPSKYSHKEPFWGLDLLNKRRKAIKEGRQREFFMDLAVSEVISKAQFQNPVDSRIETLFEGE